MSITFDELEIEPGDGGRGARTRRWVAVVLAALVAVAAVGVGYAVGRSADGDDAEAGTLDEPAPAPDEGTPAQPGSVPVESTPDQAGDGTSSSSFELESADESIAIGSSGGGGWSMYSQQPLELLSERTTESGFTIRAHLGETYDHHLEPWDDSGWVPAPWCYESGQLRVALAGNGVIDVGGVPWYSEPYQGRSVTWVSLGAVDGLPQWVVVVQAPAGTTAVTVTFADGTTDTAAPQNGVALLTVAGVPATPVEEDGYTYWSQPTPTFDVTFEGADPTTVASDGVGTWNDPEFVASCQPPPPALPDPGPQPDDPAAAEADIVDAMTVLYDATELGEKDLYVDDPTGVGEARAAVAEGPFADQADSAAAIVDELVFTSPTEAWFRYHIDTSEQLLTNRYGIAVVVDGTWKITRATVCQDLSMAGGSCVPSVAPISPPSAGAAVLQLDD